MAEKLTLQKASLYKKLLRLFKEVVTYMTVCSKRQEEEGIVEKRSRRETFCFPLFKVSGRVEKLNIQQA